MNKYEKLKKICDTHFGSIWMVKEIYSEKIFAQKMVKINQEGEEQQFQQQQNPLNEVKLLESLNHPNIIKYTETFIEEQTLNIIMEYADNGDIKLRVMEAKKDKEMIAIDTIVDWFSQLCLSVKYLYDQKILHRDLKIQNVFMMKSGILKLGDFGISKQLERTQEFASSSLGTPYYLSPEICQNSSYGHKSDIWMLGCFLYEIVTLEKPFMGEFFEIVHKIIREPFKTITREIPEWVNQLINKLLQKNPDNRPDINEILEIPQVQEKLKELKTQYPEYKDFKFPHLKRQNIKPLNITEIENQEKDQPTPNSTKSNTSKKLAKNSIYHLIEQAKRQSPQNLKLLKKNSNKLSSEEIAQIALSQQNSQVQNNAQPQQQVSQQFNSSENLNQTENQQQEQQSTNQFQQQQLQQQQQQQQLQQQQQQQQQQYPSQIKLHMVNKLKPQRPISINTAALEQQYSMRKSTPGSQKSNYSQGLDSEKHNIPTKKVSAKSFNFAHTIFNPNRAPSSPNRTILFSDFLRSKLGDERFMKMKNILESSTNPMKILDENKTLVAEIIGEENMDCIKVFKFLITSSITPPSSHGRTKSMQAFDEGLRFQAIINNQQNTINQNSQQSDAGQLSNNQYTNLNSQVSPKISPIYSSQMQSAYKKNQITSQISPKFIPPMYFNSQMQNFQYKQGQNLNNSNNNSSNCVSPISITNNQQQQQQQNTYQNTNINNSNSQVQSPLQHPYRIQNQQQQQLKQCLENQIQFGQQNNFKNNANNSMPNNECNNKDIYNEQGNQQNSLFLAHKQHLNINQNLQLQMKFDQFNKQKYNQTIKEENDIFEMTNASFNPSFDQKEQSVQKEQQIQKDKEQQLEEQQLNENQQIDINFNNNQQNQSEKINNIIGKNQEQKLQPQNIDQQTGLKEQFGAFNLKENSSNTNQNYNNQDQNQMEQNIQL